jgi:hypothetical protein
MIRFLLRRALASAERSYGESLEYLRIVLRASLGAFFRFVQVALVSRYRRVLPVGPHYVVRILAAKHEDCGPCVQTTVNMARSDGLSPALLRAVVDGHPEELAEVYRFVSGVLRASVDEMALREKIRARYGSRGDAALAEIAIVLSATRIFPVTKRVLGYARSCSQVTVEVASGVAKSSRQECDALSCSGTIEP